MLQTVAIYFGLSQITLLLLTLLRSGMRNAAELFLGLLLLCVSAEMITQLLPPDHHPVISMMLTGVYTGTAAAFWLFCLCVFDDHFHLRSWHIAIATSTVLLPFSAYAYAYHFVQPITDGMRFTLLTLPQTVEILLILHAIVVVMRQWQTDLVSIRRRIRPPLLGFSGLLILLVIVTRYIFGFDNNALLNTEYLVLAVAMLFLNVHLMAWDASALVGNPGTYPTNNPANNPGVETPAIASQRVSNVSPQNTQDQATIEKIKQLMEVEQLFKQTGLTIGQLADVLKMPEYRLRQLINGNLGYRNFNDFLNRYRSQEAANRLANPQENHIPILTIALDTGYRSLSSFNKAFREIHQLTPTEFRRNQSNPK